MVMPLNVGVWTSGQKKMWCVLKKSPPLISEKKQKTEKECLTIRNENPSRIK